MLPAEYLAAWAEDDTECSEKRLKEIRRGGVDGVGGWMDGMKKGKGSRDKKIEIKDR